MLFNPDWGKQTETADPFSLESLITWLEKQPSNETYCFSSNGHCLLAQYFLAQGFGPCVLVGVGEFSEGDGFAPWGADIRYPRVFDDVAHGPILLRTFGAALERARAALTREPNGAGHG